MRRSQTLNNKTSFYRIFNDKNETVSEDDIGFNMIDIENDIIKNLKNELGKKEWKSISTQNKKTYKKIIHLFN